MNRILCSVVITLLLATSVSAEYMYINPSAPDSNDSIVATMGGVWGDPCVPRNPTVTRSGDAILVNLEWVSRPCIAVPMYWDEAVTIGRLEPGVYTLTVTIGSSEAARFTRTFPVVDADAQHEMAPNVGSTSGGTEVLISGAFGSCPTDSSCSPPQVLFGGVPAQSVAQTIGGVIAVTPAHDAGIVDVELRGHGGTPVSVLPAAFTFHGRSAPDPAAYTPVLFPLIFNGPGAFGSQFSTEVSAYNESQVAITPLNRDAISSCSPDAVPCPESPFPGGAWELFDPDLSYPHGLVLWIPRSQKEEVHFSLRVSDISRDAEGAGTNIPAVREDELVDGALHLLNVPVTPGFRHTIRIYDLGTTTDSRVRVTAYGPGKQDLAMEFLTLTSPEEPCGDASGCTLTIPRSTTLSNFIPEGSGVDRVRLEIRPSPGMRLWAFVSVTNNLTQQITTITPE